jgi:hypothetical protein
MSDELTEQNIELIYGHTGERHLPRCPFAIEYGQVSPNVCTCPQIIGQWDSHDKMQATIDSLTEERRILREGLTGAERMMDDLPARDDHGRCWRCGWPTASGHFDFCTMEADQIAFRTALATTRSLATTPPTQEDTDEHSETTP